MDKNNRETFQYNDEHCGGCGCGVDHNHDHDYEDIDFGAMNDDIIVLTLDDDTELECLILGIFEVEDAEYIALQPIGEEDILLYGYNEINDEDFELVPIEDQEEFDTVSQAFDALFLDEEDFVEYENYDELED